MKQHLRSSAVGLVCVALAGLMGCFGCATGQSPSTATAPPSSLSTTAPQEKPLSASLPPPAATAPFVVPFYPPPDKIDLCGESVPLDHIEVFERFDREFTLIVYNNAQVYLWLKRMERYFPWLEERLRTYHLPDDLKFVAIAESDLLPTACSPKGAAGPWQFMPRTACAFGLDTQGDFDERYDFERATDCAFRYLSDLNKRFKNWSLAIAAYNCGEGRIQEETRSQGINSYYLLKLPNETERYVFRILAIKAVLSNPARYGYSLPKGQGYPELKVDRVKVTFPSRTSLHTIARAAGMTFRELKWLNPTLRADDIPAGTYEIKFPEGKGRVFQTGFASGTVRGAAPEGSSASEESTKAPDRKLGEANADSGADGPATLPEATAPSPRGADKKPASEKASKPSSPKTHTVKKGETLYSIASHYNVSVEALKAANKLKGNTLPFGKKLLIP